MNPPWKEKAVKRDVLSLWSPKAPVPSSVPRATVSTKSSKIPGFSPDMPTPTAPCIIKASIIQQSHRYMFLLREDTTNTKSLCHEPTTNPPTRRSYLRYLLPARRSRRWRPKCFCSMREWVRREMKVRKIGECWVSKKLRRSVGNRRRMNVCRWNKIRFRSWRKGIFSLRRRLKSKRRVTTWKSNYWRIIFHRYKNNLAKSRI